MRRHLLPLCCLTAALAYAGLLAARFSPEPGGADAAGYLNSARFLTEGRLTGELRIAPLLKDERSQGFQPLGFEAIPQSNRLVPIYPVGLPLHLAAVCTVFGWQAGPYFLGIGVALATLGMCYLLARELGLARGVALMLVGLLATSSVFIFSSIQPLSDTLATFWCTTAVWLALRARPGPVGWAAMCGWAFAIAVLVRPSNALLLPVLVLLLADWRKLLVTAVSGLPFAVALGLYQSHLYGSPLRSGYGDLSILFSGDYFWPTIWQFATWLGRLLPLGVFGVIFAPFLLRGGRRREVLALLVWVGVFTGFYAFYDFSRRDWSFLRFVEPAFPAMLLLGGMSLEHIVVRINPAGRARATAVMAVVIIAISAFANFSFRRPDARKHDRMYVQGRDWVAGNLPPDAVIVCSLFSGLLYFDAGHPILRWDNIAVTEWPRYLDVLHRAGQPVFALLGSSELKDPRIKQIPGKWKKLADFETASAWLISPVENSFIP